MTGVFLTPRRSKFSISSCFTNVGRDFLNILWGILVLINNSFTRKLMIFGSLLSYMLSKFVESYFPHGPLKIPVSIICYYCLLRILNYYKTNILNEEDPLLCGSDIEKMRVKKALSYLSITPRYKYLETPTNVEFLVDWKKYRENKRYKLSQDQYDSDWESDWESDSNDSDNSSDSNDDEGVKNTKLFLNETCDEAIKLTDFVENIKTTLENESEKKDIDDELMGIDDNMFQEEESIKRGWFGWVKPTKSKVVLNESEKKDIIDDELIDNMFQEEEFIKRGWFGWVKPTKSKNV